MEGRCGRRFPDFGRTRPKVIGFIGPNGSGKSSIVNRLGFVNARVGDPRFKGRLVLDENAGEVLLPLVNPDEIAKATKARQPELTDDECNRIAFEEANHVRELFARAKIDFGFESVGSHPSKVEFLSRLKEDGYIVGVLFVSTEDPAINVRRVRQRHLSGGHDVPHEKIIERYERTMSLLPQYYEVADMIAIYDNSVETSEGTDDGPRLLLTKCDKNLTVTDAGKASTWLRERLDILRHSL